MRHLFFFEIWDYLKLDENQDGNGNFSTLRLIGQNILSVAFLLSAIGALVFGAGKIKERLESLRKPFLESLAAEESKRLEEEEKKEKKRVLR